MTKPAITYRNEWLEPEKLGQLLKGVAAVAAGLATLKEKFSKRGGSKRDLKKLGDEIDDLRDSLSKLLEIVGTLAETQKLQIEGNDKVFNSLLNLCGNLHKRMDALSPKK